MLANHLPRAQAQELVKQASREVMKSGKDLLQIVAERVDTEIDWHQVQADAERPACATLLIDRVLAEAASQSGSLQNEQQ